MYTWLKDTHSLEELTIIVIALYTLHFLYRSSLISVELMLYKDLWVIKRGEEREGIGIGVAMAISSFS